MFLLSVAPGISRIERKSSESSLTISFDRTFPLQLDGSYTYVSGGGGHSENAILSIGVSKSSDNAYCGVWDLIVC